MLRSSAIALAASISICTLGLTTDASARGGGFGGGHFGGGFGGGGHFGGGCATSAAACATSAAACATSTPRCVSPAWRTAGRQRTTARWTITATMTTALTTLPRAVTTTTDSRRSPRRRRRRAPRRRSADVRDHADQDHRDLDNRNLDNRDDLAHNWNNLHQPVNVGRWDHNGFWNNNWNARNFNCPAAASAGSARCSGRSPTATCSHSLGGPTRPRPRSGTTTSTTSWAGCSGRTAPTPGRQGLRRHAGRRPTTTTPTPASRIRTSTAPAPPTAATTSRRRPRRRATASSRTSPRARLCAGRLQPADRQDRAEREADGHAARRAQEPRGRVQRGRDHPQGLCPSSPPLTPVGRLDALQKRLDAMAKGLDLVRAPLTKFDGSLSAEQKQQLDAMGGGKATNPAGPVLDAERGVHQRADAGDRGDGEAG